MEASGERPRKTEPQEDGDFTDMLSPASGKQVQDDPDADPQWDSCSVLFSKTCIVISSAISTSPPGLRPQGGKELITT